MTEPSNLKHTVRTAGWLYLALAVTGAIALAYMPSQIYVKGDPETTVANLIAKEQLLRWSVLSQLTSQVLFIFLVLTLYRLFSGVDIRLSRAMVALVIVQVPIVFIIELFSLSSLLVAKGEWMPSLAQPQRAELTMMMLRLRSQTIGLAEVFWGLWLIPFGMLVIRSGMIPKLIGYMLIIGGIAYLIECSTSIVAEEHIAMVVKVTSKLYALAEIVTILWLVIVGARISKQKISLHG